MEAPPKETKKIYDFKELWKKQHPYGSIVNVTMDDTAPRTSTRTQRDALMRDPDVLGDFLKWGESKYGYDLKQYDPAGKGRNAKSRKPSPSNDEFFGMWDQYWYNLERKHNQGMSAISFGDPTYSPYDHSDDDNEVWGDFIGKYGRLPSQQEFESSKNQYVTARQEKFNKGVADLLDVSYKAGTAFRTNDYWKQLGFVYDPLDVLDAKRRDAGLPPKAYLDKYNRNDPEDVLRLQQGEIPKYYDNTAKALKEMRDFEQMIMGMAAENKITGADHVQKLYSEGVHPYLNSIDDLNKKLTDAQDKEGDLTDYDRITGKTANLPREHLDMAAMRNAGYSPEWIAALYGKAAADQEQKYGNSSAAAGFFRNIAGWFEETPYEAQLRGAATPSAGKPPALVKVGSEAKKRGVIETAVNFGENILGVPARDTLATIEGIRTALGEIAASKDPNDLGNRIKRGWVKGELTVIRGLEAVKAMRGEANRLDEVNEILQSPEFTRAGARPAAEEALNNLGNTAGSLVEAAIEQIPQYAEALTNAAPGVGRIYKILSQILGNEDVVEGLKTAFTNLANDPNWLNMTEVSINGLFSTIYYTATGNAYADSIQEGIGHDLSLISSRLIGVVTTGVEIVATVIEGETAGAGTAATIPIKKALTTGLGKAASFITRAILKTGSITATETLEEIGQQAWQMAVEESAKAYSNAARGTALPQRTFGEWIRELGATAQEAIRAMILTAAFGGVTGARADVRTKGTGTPSLPAHESVQVTPQSTLDQPAAAPVTAQEEAGTASDNIDRAPTESTQIKVIPIGEADAQEYLYTGSRQHVRNQKAELVSQGESVILPDQDAINQFVDEAISGEKAKVIKVFGKVGDTLANDVSAASGGKVDIVGYYLELTADWLKHMKDEHGNEMIAGQLPLSADIIKSIPEYIASYDRIESAAQRPNGSTSIVISKRIDGHIIMVEIVSRNRKSLSPITAYIYDTEKYRTIFGNKTDVGSQGATASENARLGTSENAPHTDTSDHIITHENEKNQAAITGFEIFTPVTNVETEEFGGLTFIDKKGDLTPFQEKILNDIGTDPERRQQVKKVFDQITGEINFDADTLLEYLENNKTQGTYVTDGYFSGKTVGGTNNEKWYRDLFHENNREKAPNEARLRRAAVEFMLDENSEFYNPEFAEKFNVYKELKPFMDRLDKGGDIASVEKRNDGTYKVSYGRMPESRSRSALVGDNEVHSDWQNAMPARYQYKSLIDSFLEVKDTANKVESPRAKNIAKKAQEMLDEITKDLRDDMEATGMDSKALRRSNLAVNEYEEKLKGLVKQLQDEIKAAKEKAKADLKKLRDAKNVKLAEAEKKRQADVLAMRIKKNDEMARKLAKAEVKRRIDLAILREAKNTAVERAATKKVLSDLRSLYNNEHDRPLQKELRDALPEFIRDLGDLRIRKGDRVNASRLIQFLNDFQKGETGNDLLSSVWDDLQPAIDILTDLNGRDVADLTGEELRNLRKAMHNIITVNKEAYNVLADGEKVKTKVVVDQILQANEGKKDISDKRQTGTNKEGKERLFTRVADYFGVASWELHNVANLIMRTTKENTFAHKILSKALERAGWTHADYRLTDHDAITGLLKGLDRKKWFKQETEYELPSGQKVKLTLDELAAVYLNSFNPENRKSLNNQIRLEKRAHTFNLTEADAEVLIDIARNTPDVKRVGDGLLQWNAEAVQPRINKASQQRFGFDMADVEGYWPIYRDTQEMVKGFTIMGRTLETFGWQQKRVGSRLPIVLRGALETAVRMSEETAMFSAYAVPVKSIQRVLRQPVIQKLLREKFGAGVVRYYDTFLREGVVKQGGQAERGAGAMLWLARSAQAAILSTPKVVMNQFAGIAAAVAYLNPRYMMGAFIKRADLKLMRKFAPMMYERRVLGGSPEAGALMDMGMLPETGVDRIRSTATRGIQWGDTVTMDLAWNWAERQVKAENPKLAGDELYTKVGALAQEVVGRTQPTNEIGYRSLIENTKSPVEKLMLPFTSGINKVYNILIDCVLSYASGNTRKARSLMSGIVANTLAFGVVSALWNRLWKGKDDEPFWKQFGAACFENIVTLPYIGGLVYSIGTSVVNGAEYSMRVIATDTLEALVNAIRKGYAAFAGLIEAGQMPDDTKAERDTKNKVLEAAVKRIPGFIHDFVAAGAPIYGVPVQQFERDILLPVMKWIDLPAYYAYQGTIKSDSGASKDFKSEAKTNKEKAREILEIWVGEKGKDSVKRSWQNSDWYKALSPADKRYWDAALRGMR